jgi:cysteine synthase
VTEQSTTGWPPATDPLLAPFTPVPPERILDFDCVHQRYPALAAFRQRLGDTPLREVPSVPGGATILAKCEWENPAGSVKDRAAYALLCDALRRHGNGTGPRVLEYSGGNLADALSWLGAETGVPMRLVVSSFSPPSLLDRLRDRGAIVDIVDKHEGFLGVIRQAQRIATEDPSWLLLFQHVNPVNLAFHEQTTGREILAQLAGREPHTWIASIGSGGTLVGVLRALRPHYPNVRAIGVTPTEAPYGTEEPPNAERKFGGAAGLGYGIRQPFVRACDSEIAAHYQVSCREALDAMAEFYDLTGIRIGGSSGANWLVARRIAAELPPDAVVLTLFACAGTPEQWKELGR